MSRAIWTGAISFGLINIPVEVHGASEPKSLSFHMLDSADNGPIGYKKINKSTGREVPSRRIVKGYEYETDQYVIVTGPSGSEFRLGVKGKKWSPIAGEGFHALSELRSRRRTHG